MNIEEDIKDDVNIIFESLVNKYNCNTFEEKNKVFNIIFTLAICYMVYYVKPSEFKCYADQFRAGLLDFIEKISKMSEQEGINYE